MNEARQLLKRAMTYVPKSSNGVPEDLYDKILDFLFTPEPTQDEEPVAWGMTDSVGNIVDTITEYDREGDMAEWSHQYPVPLFRHPAPRREFVRLSGYEISELWSEAEDAFVFARDIEILSREKNNE